MESKKWTTFGDEAATAASEFLNFEKSFKPALAKKIAEHDDLESKAEKLELKLSAERVDFDQKKAVFFAGLRETEIKIRADARKEVETLTAKGKQVSEIDIDEAVIAALEKKARGVTSLRSQALDCLTLERDLAKIKMNIAMLVSETFQRRREVARDFCLKLFETAGLAVTYKTFDQELAEASRWSKELTRLEMSLAIAEGSLKHFESIGLSAGTADGLLEFACYIPAQEIDQVLTAWSACKLANGKGCGVSYDQRRKVSWRFTKSPNRESKHIMQTSDFGSGSTSRQRARA